MICKVFYNISDGLIQSVEESGSSVPVSEALITEMLAHTNYGIIQVSFSDPDVDGTPTSSWASSWKVDTASKKLVAV